MGDLTTYFGIDTMRTFLDEASDNINKFSAQNAATKADIADDLKVKNVIYERSVPILLDALDTVQAQNEIKDIVIKNDRKTKYQKWDFIRQEEITVVMTKKRKHARTALVNYLTSMIQLIQQQSQQRKTTN